jgi:predicted O-methyltransferase YrrM
MLNFRFAKDYLLHRLKGKTRHGTHSPFVYRLVDEVIYDFSQKKVYEEIEKLRGELLSDERVINVTDLGSGSRVKMKERRSVKKIVKNVVKPYWLAQLIYRLVADSRPATVIELGTSLGITTVYLSNTAPGGQVYTLEGCPETLQVAKEVFEKAGTKNVKLITGNFDDTLPGLIDSLDKLDCVFIDGNHTKEATLRYFEECLPKTHENTLLIFDDIYWSKGMKEAWNHIKADLRVTVTIDLFWMGLVYFRKGQVKEDFVIKF